MSFSNSLVVPAPAFCFDFFDFLGRAESPQNLRLRLAIRFNCSNWIGRSGGGSGGGKECQIESTEANERVHKEGRSIAVGMRSVATAGISTRRRDGLTVSLRVDDPVDEGAREISVHKDFT